MATGNGNRRAIVSDDVQIGGVPGAPNTDQRPRGAQHRTLRADPRQQYVSATGDRQWLANYARALSWSIDDLTRDFGDDTYDRMLLDPQIFACLSVLKAGILQEGAQLASVIDDEDDPQFQRAADLTDWCTRILDDLATPLDDVLWNMLDALAMGNKLAELVYDLDATYSAHGGARGPQLILRQVSVKPRRSTAYLVDVYNNVLGILGLIPGVAFPVQAGTILIDVDGLPNLLPREKFALLTCRPRDNDPRGTSILRAAYDPWWQKVQLAPEFLKYLTQFAGPSALGYTAEEAMTLPYEDTLANVTVDPVTGVPMTAAGVDAPLQSPEQQMATALQQWRNGSVAVFPHGAAVDVVQSQGDGAAFLNAFTRFDQQITKAILHQTLATEEGQHQARAAASVHQDVLDTIIRQARLSVQRMVRRDILTPLIRYNYGEPAVALVPKVTLGETAAPDVPQMLQSLGRVGYTVDPSQFAGIDAMINLPPRLENTDAAPGVDPAADGADDGSATTGTPPQDGRDQPQGDQVPPGGRGTPPPPPPVQPPPSGDTP